MPGILFFGHRSYPNDHAVLETIFTVHLPPRGFQTVWVLQPKSTAESGKNALWNQTPVYVTRRRHWRGILRHLELFREYLRRGAEAIRQHDIAIIQARTGIPEGLVAWYLARRYGKKLVFQYSFPTIETRRQRFQNTALSWMAPAAYWLHYGIIRFVMQQSHLVLAISDSMRDEWIARGIKHIVTFPLGADTRIDPTNVVPADMPPETVVYFGALDPNRKMNFLLDVFQRVLKFRPDAHLLIVGNTQGSGLEAYADQLGIRSQVTFTGQVARVEVARYIRASRCSVAPIVPDPQFLIASTTKVIESLALGVPVVANCEIRDQHEVLERSGGGFSPPYDVQAFVEAIVHLLADSEDAKSRGQRGYEYVIQERSYAVLSEKLIADYAAYTGIRPS